MFATALEGFHRTDGQATLGFSPGVTRRALFLEEGEQTVVGPSQTRDAQQ